MSVSEMEINWSELIKWIGTRKTKCSLHSDSLILKWESDPLLVQFQACWDGCEKSHFFQLWGVFREHRLVLMAPVRPFKERECDSVSVHRRSPRRLSRPGGPCWSGSSASVIFCSFSGASVWIFYAAGLIVLRQCKKIIDLLYRY